MSWVNGPVLRINTHLVLIRKSYVGVVEMGVRYVGECVCTQPIVCVQAQTALREEEDSTTNTTTSITAKTFGYAN